MNYVDSGVISHAAIFTMLQNATIVLWFSAAYGSIHIPAAKSDTTWKVQKKRKSFLKA